MRSGMMEQRDYDKAMLKRGAIAMKRKILKVLRDDLIETRENAKINPENGEYKVALDFLCSAIEAVENCKP